MNYLKTKIILFVWATIFVVMTSLVVYEYLRLENTKEYTSSLEREIIQEKDSIQSLDSLVKSFSNIKEDSEKINTFFVKKDEVVNFLDTIESLASSTKTQLSIQSVVDKNIASSSTLLSVGINARGTYSNLHYLIRLLEELPYQTEIQNIRLSNGVVKDDKNQSVSSWTADITIVAVML